MELVGWLFKRGCVLAGFRPWEEGRGKRFVHGEDGRALVAGFEWLWRKWSMQNDEERAVFQ